jgi:hypothetical protein
LERLPDVPKGVPLIPCVLEWTSGERIVLKDDDGLPKMVPLYDPMLEHFVMKHEHDLPDKAVTHGDQIQVVAVDQRTWDSMDMVTKIKTELQQQTGHVYDENTQHREDALKCYNAHGNPDATTGCRDYLDSSKLIGAATYEDEGHKIEIPPQFRQYLCFMCPFQQTYVTTEIRRQKGYYDEQKNLAVRAKRRRLGRDRRR